MAYREATQIELGASELAAEQIKMGCTWASLLQPCATHRRKPPMLVRLCLKELWMLIFMSSLGVMMTKYECIDHVHYGDNLILALSLNKSSRIICETDNVAYYHIQPFNLTSVKINLMVSRAPCLRDQSHGLKDSTLKWS
uniref:Uncharacterized protein n=1 Tax=Oryza brachyantha TaxID=4533 RepID=J3NCD6_ORYBR